MSCWWWGSAAQFINIFYSIYRFSTRATKTLISLRRSESPFTTYGIIAFFFCYAKATSHSLELCGSRQAKECLRTWAKCADWDYPAHAQSITLICTVWSRPSLSAYTRRQVFAWRSPYMEWWWVDYITFKKFTQSISDAAGVCVCVCVRWWWDERGVFVFHQLLKYPDFLQSNNENTDNYVREWQRGWGLSDPGLPCSQNCFHFEHHGPYFQRLADNQTVNSKI